MTAATPHAGYILFYTYISDDTESSGSCIYVLPLAKLSTKQRMLLDWCHGREIEYTVTDGLVCTMENNASDESIMRFLDERLYNLLKRLYELEVMDRSDLDDYIRTYLALCVVQHVVEDISCEDVGRVGNMRSVEPGYRMVHLTTRLLDDMPAIRDVEDAVEAIGPMTVKWSAQKLNENTSRDTGSSSDSDDGSTKITYVEFGSSNDNSFVVEGDSRTASLPSDDDSSASVSGSTESSSASSSESSNKRARPDE